MTDVPSAAISPTTILVPLATQVSQALSRALPTRSSLAVLQDLRITSESIGMATCWRKDSTVPAAVRVPPVCSRLTALWCSLLMVLQTATGRRTPHRPLAMCWATGVRKSSCAPPIINMYAYIPRISRPTIATTHYGTTISIVRLWCGRAWATTSHLTPATSWASLKVSLSLPHPSR